VEHDRRRFLKSSGIVLSTIVGGEILRVSPRSAQAAALPYQILTEEEVATLQGLAEAIVPGAREAGVSHYVDKQLGAVAHDCLLMLRYLGVPFADFIGFYQSGLHSADRLARLHFSLPWSALSIEQGQTLLLEMNGNADLKWGGPPAPFFFFVLRADASDVVYGTEQGFDQIGMPYMAHIEPPQAW
jgi:hypothetical protein